MGIAHWASTWARNSESVFSICFKLVWRSDWKHVFHLNKSVEHPYLNKYQVDLGKTDKKDIEGTMNPERMCLNSCAWNALFKKCPCQQPESGKYRGVRLSIGDRWGEAGEEVFRHLHRTEPPPNLCLWNLCFKSYFLYNPANLNVRRPKSF